MEAFKSDMETILWELFVVAYIKERMVVSSLELQLISKLVLLHIKQYYLHFLPQNFIQLLSILMPFLRCSATRTILDLFLHNAQAQIHSNISAPKA
jgi:hypothetical protein